MAENIDDVVKFWQNYFNQNPEWQELVKNISPEFSDCGPVYMLQQLPKRPRESLTIVDMRDFEISRPYYRGYTEIIFVLRGEGLVVVGTTPIKVGPGSVLRIPPDTAHFMVPKDLVLGVVTIGSGYEDGRTFLQESDPRVGFDRSRYEEFSAAI